MRKRYAYVGLIIITTIAVFFDIQWHQNRYNAAQSGSLSVLVPSISITPTPLPVIENFLILPNNYQLSAEERELVNKSDIQTILIEDPIRSYFEEIAQTFPLLKVYGREGENSFTYCKGKDQAVNHDSATLYTKANEFIGYGDCNAEHKINNILRMGCRLDSPLCQNDFLEAAKDVSANQYLYVPSYPLVSLYRFPKLTIDRPFGTDIITWDQALSPISVSSYSVELLNTEQKRIYASGKLTSTAKGHYFVPIQNIQEQTLSAKIRFWLKIGKIAFKEPLISEAFFLYKPEVSIQTAKQNKAKQMSWIPDWGMSEGIESVKMNPKKWDTISPVWYVLNKSGKLDTKATANSQTLLALLRKNNISIVPTISTFDADIVREVLRNHFNSHIQNIVSLVEKNNYDGIDLDYESTYADDKELLLSFVTKLSEELHNKGKILSFTALPKIDNREVYAFLPQTHIAQDWKAIGAVVDEFRIMAYDFTGQGSLEPGPLSPYTWNETLIRYAIAQMPASKVVLALPLYSHGWPNQNSTNLAGKNNDKSLSSGELKNTISLQHDSIDYIKRHSPNYKESYDVWTKEVRATFTYNKIARTMYYLDKRGVDNRIDLAEKYGIKGVCYWRIGGEKLD